MKSYPRPKCHPIILNESWKFQCLMLGFFVSTSALSINSDEAARMAFRSSAVKTSLLSIASVAVLVPVQLSEPINTCRWCTPNSFDMTLANKLQWSNRQAARSASDVVLYGVAPFISLGTLALLHDNWHATASNAMALSAAVLTTMTLTNLIKQLARRTRPEAFMGYSDFSKNDAYFSFLSGHTSLAFAMISASAYLSLKRDSSATPYLIIGGTTAAAMAGYLRLAAAKHWASDVLAGMGLGVAMGILVPHWILAHQPPLISSITPTFDHLGLAVSMRW